MTYKDLKSYQNAVIIHDFTVEFIKRYIPANSRTRDQMEQAARSGKQNIAEATSSSKQKPKSEPLLLGVASASLKELLEDYQDYLRQHQLKQWDKNDSRALRVRGLYRSYTSNKTYATYQSYRSDTTYKSYQTYLSNAEDACNAMICLINQTTYLLDNQIRAVELQLGEKGIGQIGRDGIYRSESHEQRLRRIMSEDKKREQEIDGIIKETMKKL